MEGKGGGREGARNVRVECGEGEGCVRGGCGEGVGRVL